MKKVRVFLSVMAFVFAIGGTFAGQYLPTPSMTGYEFISGIPDQCISSTVNCDTSSSNLCTLNGHVVGATNTPSTSCGTQLKKK